MSRSGRARRQSAAHILPLSFLAAIAAGTLLLLLPVSSADGRGADVLTALFTAVTSCCVTGLVVVDTFSYWSAFGKGVILLLIQVGGLGVVASLALVQLLMRRRFSLSDRALIADAFNLDTRAGVLSFLLRVVRGTLAVEAAGALLYSFSFVPEYGAVRGLCRSCFTSISAFCNAGIDILGPDSLARYAESPGVLLTTMALVVLGGLGFAVWFDCADGLRRGRRLGLSPARVFGRLGEHTRLVLILTPALTLSGALLFFLCERGNPGTFGPLSPGGKALNALFQSVTLRTAGFTVFPQQNFTGLSFLASCLLMFIGGSPAGTAGGVKTVTVFLVLQNAFSFVRGRRETVVCRRRVPEEMLRRAAAIVTVSLLCVIVLTGLLLALEPLSVQDAFFEIASACGTVGLSRGVTPALSGAGRLVVALSMYLGRIGPLSMALFFVRPGRGERLSWAPGRFFVG